MSGAAYWAGVGTCLVGVGKLRLAQLSIEAFTEVCVTVDRIYGDCSSTARNLRVPDSLIIYTDVREGRG